jgi:spore coat protein U-like protein
MSARWLQLALLAWALLAGSAAHAAITCTSITSPGASFNYVNNTTMTAQTFFTVSCTRTSTGDPVSISYDVTANNGTSPSGQNNRATHSGGAQLRYDFFVNSSCGTSWKGTRKISDVIDWGSSATTGTITKQTSYWACITTSQTAAASGLYADTVSLTLTYGVTTVLGAAPVAIYAPASCTLTSFAGNLVLNYTAFSALMSRTTTVGFTCTIGMPYTVATDVQEAVLAGVRYQLSITDPSSTGTGSNFTHTITATVPGGQAGACGTGSCTGTRVHTVTVTY